MSYFKKLNLTVILTVLFIFTFNAAAYSAGENIVLKPGFNFISFKSASGITPGDFKKLNPAIENIYAYDAKISTFFSYNDGDPFSLSRGNGYIVKTNSASDITVSVPGEVSGAVGSIKLYKSFNIAGFTNAPGRRSFKSLMEQYTSIKGMYKWDAGLRSFIAVLRDTAGVELIDGVDPEIVAGEAYYMKMEAETYLNYDGSSIIIGDNILKTSIPEFTPAGGAYNSAQQVTISCATSGASIHYTTDGSTPGPANGAIYTGPIQVPATAVIKAVAIKSEMIDSDVTEASYTIGGGFTKISLKPGSGLSCSLTNLTNAENVLVIPYSKQQYVSYTLSITSASGSPLLLADNNSIFNPNASFSSAPSLAASGNVETTGQIKSDMIKRANEARTLSSLKSEPAAGMAALKAPSAAPARAQVGDTMTFYALNSLQWPPYASDWTKVTAKLRGIGTHCYIYEDTYTSGYGTLTSSDITRFTNGFDNEIYPKDVAAFGSEPNPGIDNDSKVYILFTRNVNIQSAAGYFDSTNQLRQSYLDGSTYYNKNSSNKYYSNEKEMFYMAAPKSDLSSRSTFQTNTLGVLAHEFQHMINWNEHNILNSSVTEDPWINEGLSQVAQDICGYGYQYGTLAFVIDPFLRSPEYYSLTDFRFSLGYYGNSYLFTRYLVDRGANIQNMVKTSKIGVTNVETEIIRSGLAASFDDFYEDFIVTLFAASNAGFTTDSKYSFKDITIKGPQKDGTTLGGVSVSKELTIPASSNGPSMNAYSMSYIKCSVPSNGSYNVKLTESTSGKIGATVIRYKK